MRNFSWWPKENILAYRVMLVKIPSRKVPQHSKGEGEADSRGQRGGEGLCALM